MSENFTSMKEAVLKAQRQNDHELYSKLLEGISGVVTHTSLLILALRYKQQNIAVRRGMLLALNLILVIVAYRKIYE